MDENEGSMTFSYRFWELLCANTSALFMLLVVCVVLLALSLAIYPFSEPGTGSHVLLQLDIGLLVGFSAVLSGLIYRCYEYRV